MKKQTRTNNLQKVFPFIFIAGAMMQACGGPGGGSASPSVADVGANPSCSQAMSAPGGFFEEIDNAQALPAPDEDVQPVRYRYVKADIEALKGALRSRAPRIRLDLFADKAVDVLVEGIQKVSESNFIMTGRIADDILSSVSLVVNDQTVVANVHPSQGARYMVQFHGDDAHSISEIDDADAEHCEAEDGLVAASLESPADDEDSTPDESDFENNALASLPVIDMLVAYTPAARAKAGGTSAIKAIIQMGIADTNRAFSASGVNLAVRLVGTMETFKNDTNQFSSNLSSLAGKTDGRWDEVHAKRRELGADQVTLVGVYPRNGTNGIGYIGASYSRAFTVVKLSSFGAYSFTHELGHNIGLNHSDGYLNSAGRFRTVMSYGSVPRIRRFSNPGIAYNGFRTGDSNQNSAGILNSRGKFTSALTLVKVPLKASDIEMSPAIGDGGSCQ